MDLDELWIQFGVGKGTRYITIHALTGSDQTSGFAGRSKKTAWAVWNTLPEFTDGLLIINDCPSKEDVEFILPVIERFVVLIYMNEEVLQFPLTMLAKNCLPRKVDQ